MEPPPDELVQSVGLLATAVHLGPTDEFIHLTPPYKISAKTPVTIRGWPSDIAATWVIWQYPLRESEDEDYSRLETTTNYAKFLDFLKAQAATPRETGQ